MPSSVGAPQRAAARALARWGAAEGRTLPWRYSGDRYKLAVAEVLLQKTKAVAVVPIWRSVVGQYPTAGALACADYEEVRALVGPLGLGRQRAARLLAVAADLDGHPPQRTGIGPYGSAMLALESGLSPDEPPVDGNIARVLSRSIGAAWDRGEPRKKREVREAAHGWLTSVRGRRAKLQLAYALVDLGALICTPRNPRCSRCPISNQCLRPR